MTLTKGQLYGRRWQAARARHLRKNPLCVMCREDGRITEATVVDHIEQHNGDPSLFWNPHNWQSLCKPHHDSTKQREECLGHKIGCDISGNPEGWRDGG
jgi:5-methylcytosine-specific restriction protein A